MKETKQSWYPLSSSNPWLSKTFPTFSIMLRQLSKILKTNLVLGCFGTETSFQKTQRWDEWNWAQAVLPFAHNTHSNSCLSVYRMCSDACTRLNYYFNDFPWPKIKFYDFSWVLENEIRELHDFPGFQWPGLRCTSKFSVHNNTDLYNIHCFLSPGFCCPFLSEAELSVFAAA